MELVADVCHMESRFSLFGYSVSFGVTYVHVLCRMNYRLRNHFGRTRWYS